ncbi:MAG TPA: MFS transporter [Candidatus Eisenbacteria bacterium]|nr:MFS transporter [Candidatus Eisenbacteria bacterium]
MKRKRVAVRDSLNASLKDGACAALMGGVTEHYAIPLALFLGASVQQIGLVSALPNLLASLSQFLAVRVIYLVGGRIKLLVRLVLGQATVIGCIAVLPWTPTPWKVELLLACLILAAVSGGLAGPAWGSLMSDYVPASKRGRYFGWRNRLVGGVTIGSILGSGLLLSVFRDYSYRLGFSLLFFFAALARYFSAYFIHRMGEPPHKADPASDFTFLMFVARFKESNFLKFVAFAASLNFATYLSAPFFAVFMLRDLGFDYLTYMALQVGSSLAALIALPLWGRHADLVGNVRVLRLASLFAALIPAFWLVSHHPLYLMAVQIWAGFTWSGVTLATGNFIYDAVTPPKRVRCIAYFNVINGTAIFAGASLGGLLAAHLPPVFGFSLLALFAVSSLARLSVYLLMSRSFREVRRTHDATIQELFFSVIGIRPLVGPARD